jgi:hypothetical protein
MNRGALRGASIYKIGLKFSSIDLPRDDCGRTAGTKISSRILHACAALFGIYFLQRRNGAGAGRAAGEEIESALIEAASTTPEVSEAKLQNRA